jgi:hypothetical protein
MHCSNYQRATYAPHYSGYTQKLKERPLGGKSGATYRKESAQHCAHRMH